MSAMSPTRVTASKFTIPRLMVSAMYGQAQEIYDRLGVNTETAIATALKTPLSIQCWQGDDVHGFEMTATGDMGGIGATGNYLGAARTPDELRNDFDKAASLIPGAKKLSLHACYLEAQGPVERNAIAPEHFKSFIDWARAMGYGLDFNETYFNHPMVKDGLTLSSPDDAVRAYWITHGNVCRVIAEAFAKALNQPSGCNLWIPDSSKDVTVDRTGPEERLIESLDAIFGSQKQNVLDFVESKLFGIGGEDYTVGSHEFYLGYAVSRAARFPNLGLTYDMGHFHPTETIHGKISPTLHFVNRLLFHISRGVRWDSDHVPMFNDDLKNLMDAIIRGNYLDRASLGLDYFDASINRIAAWIIGARAARMALLNALLEPSLGKEAEAAGDPTTRLAMAAGFRSILPFGAVWNELCVRANVPTEGAWLADVAEYEGKILSLRDAGKKV